MRFLYVLAPIALLAAALFFTWQGFQAPPAETATVQPEPPRYSVTGAQWLRLGRLGEPEFRAEAASVDYFADGTVRLHTISVDALGGYESPWHVEAPLGEAPPRERRILLTGDVRAVGRNIGGAPVTFGTTRLWVDLLRHELHTDAPVQLQADFRSARARGLRADFAGERVQLLNDVRVDYAPEG